MRLAISNIAWDTSEDEQIAVLLAKYNLDAIDIAPGKYFPAPESATVQEIDRVRSWWNQRGMEITGMQGLLFGTSGLNIFGNVDVQQATLNRLQAICRIAQALGARNLVFGSPKNRDRSGLSNDETLDRALAFFRRLGDIAANHEVVFCLEPNPAKYGANFMMTSAETFGIVKQVNHSSIAMQFDTGALTINGENPAGVLAQSKTKIAHIHASEPDLLPIGDGSTDHRAMHAELQSLLPHHTVCIEMVATHPEPHAQSIERALAAAIRFYRPDAPK